MVVAIISLLLGLLLPAVHIARERARETVCKNNVYQINFSVVQFVEVHKKLPRAGRAGKIGGWVVDTLPFIEQKNLQSTIVWGSELARAPDSLNMPPAIFRCPRSTALDATPPDKMWRGHYTLVTDEDRRYLMGIYDSPIDLDIPWLTGPEMFYQRILKLTGPHHEGFYKSSGGQQGITFMINGKDVR